MMTCAYHRFRMIAFYCIIALLALAAVVAAQDEPVLSEGFEAEVPDLHTYQATYAADDSRAHTGARSLRVTPDPRGGAYFRLDGTLDPTSDYQFSAWVYAGAEGAVQLYISASDGETRHTKASVSGGKAGEWVQLVGAIRAEDFRENDCDLMLAMVGSAESWFDDVAIIPTEVPDPPLEVYPHLETFVRTWSNSRISRLEPGRSLRLRATDGAFAPDLAQLHAALPDEPQVRIPADGLLTFAVDVPEATWVTGSLRLRPDEDLRPGLRAYVLSDSTLIAAPMVTARDWGPVPVREAIPDIRGRRPSPRVQLTEWLLPAGRHYITVAGPHSRPAGEFVELRLRTTPRPVEQPLMAFTLFSDTHLSTGRSPWMNVIMYEPSVAALRDELQSLQASGADFALIAGDMTNSGTAADFELLAGVLNDVDLPVYGCIGNHDSYLESSRPDALRLVPELFPRGELNYVLERGSLRFIVLDASYWRTRDGSILDHIIRDDWVAIGLPEGQMQWLRETLAADTQTPTIVVWHYGFHDRLTASSCGHLMRGSTCADSAEALDAIEQAPNVIATLCGHSHWNQVNVVEGITHVQNPGFAEWPNAYRVFRVYRDRIEWELRQVANRGLIREAFTPEKAQSWMISTGPGDLTGTVPLTRVLPKRR